MVSKNIPNVRTLGRKRTANPKYADYESDNPEKKKRPNNDKSGEKGSAKEKSGCSQKRTKECIVNQTDDDGVRIIIRHSDDQVSDDFHEESEESDSENQSRREERNSGKEKRKGKFFGTSTSTDTQDGGDEGPSRKNTIGKRKKITKKKPQENNS